MLKRQLNHFRCYLLASLLGSPSKKDLISGVENSIKKYGKTYKLLEKYDQKPSEDSKSLVKSRTMQNYLRSV